MFEKLDGTNRPPRSIQIEALGFIQKNLYTNALPICLNLPTGVGKSFILRAIQLESIGSIGIVPSNSLMDQYIKTYPELNYLKGREHYPCEEHEGYNCQEAKVLFKSKCENCLYTKQRIRAEKGESTIFNPISYYYFKKNSKLEKPPILIVDEAHKLIDTLELLVDFSFRKKKYNYPENLTSFVELLDWIVRTCSKLEMLIRSDLTKDPEEKKILIGVIDKLRFIEVCYRANPQDFIFFEELRDFRGAKEKYLVVKPINPPKFLLNDILDCEKLILMSATLLQHDIWAFNLSEYVYQDFPSPIPKELREIHYRPSKTPLRYDSDPQILSKYIQEVLESFPENPNTIIHVSYSWSKKLKPFFPTAMFNDSLDKDKILAQFKEKGGIWFAGGCSEGIDLPGNECRLILIPIIFKPNPMDPVYKKQITQQNGWIKTELNTIKTVIQQAGRASRNENDYSVTVICDSAFPRMINKIRKFLPKSFLETIKWTKS